MWILADRETFIGRFADIVRPLLVHYKGSSRNCARWIDKKADKLIL
jgi:hypothetical protein